MIRTLFSVKGNPKVLLLLEPLNGIPFTLVAPYITLYMQSLGLSDVQIGIIISVTACFQVFFAFSGGLFTDKFGRKKITILGDLLGWTIPCLIWAYSQNIWWFLIAAAFNGFEQVNQTAWVCLMVEDADQNQMVHIWNWIFIAGMLSVFFAPISGFFVSKGSVVSVMRVLYIIFAISMLIKVIVTWKCAKETKQGNIRREVTRTQSIWQMAKGYRQVLTMIIHDKNTVLTFAVVAILACTNVVTSNFFSLYVTSKLEIPAGLLVVFPIIRAVIVVLTMFLIPKKLEELSIKVPMLMGFMIYIGCQILLIKCPPGSLSLLIIYIIFDAIAFSLVSPRKETMLSCYINENERARTISLMTAFSFTITIPFGYLTGLLSSINRQFPFILCLAFYILITIILATNKLDKVASS